VEDGPKVTEHITIEDSDDRPQRMVADPDRYFADARRRAEQELSHQVRRLLSGLRPRKRR
jgi:hypothetical protein